MQKRRLGQTDLEIAPLVFGGNVFGWTADEPTSFSLLDRFTEAGLNAIDTADVYSSWVPGNSGGESETIIGKWMKDRKSRDRVVIVTKVGSDLGEGKKGLSAAYIEQAVDASLKRLQTDVIDLYLSHWPDASVPYAETLGAYQRLIEKGKIRNAGASNLDAGQLAEALDVSRKTGLPRYAVLQPEYNLFDRFSFDGPLRDLCMKEDIGVITYFSLAKGVSERQVPQQGGPRSEPARRRHGGLSLRSRHAHTHRSRRCFGAPWRQAGRGSTCLDHRAQGRHGTDCQRHDACTARQSHQGDDAFACRCRHRRAGHCKRGRLTGIRTARRCRVLSAA